MNKRLLFLFSFCIPVILYTGAFALHRIWPFGGITVMTGDMRFQFIDYLSYLKSIVFGTNDFAYSFSKNLGGNMAGFSAYYFFSPLNWITLLFPSSWLPIAEELVILLTAGLSGLSCMAYLMEKYGSGWFLLIFSTAWSLTGYAVTYYQLTIYAGTLILLPLLVMGLERLTEKPEKRGLYLWTLFLIILGNYYSGFMVCLFSLLYFIWLLLLKKEKYGEASSESKGFFRENRERIRSFLYASVLAAMLSGFALVPAVLSLRGEKNTLAVGFFRTFPLQELPAQFLSGSFYGNVSAGLPNLYCGVPVLFFFLLYLTDRRIPRGERRLAGGLILFLLFTMWINTLNVIWHGLNQPIGFPYRYSYLVSFLLISFSCREFAILMTAGPGKEPADKRIPGFILLGFCLYGVFLLLSGHPGIGKRDLVLNGILFAVPAVGFLLLKKKLSARAFLLLILLLECSDLTYNTSEVLSHFELADLKEYQDYLEKTGAKLDLVKAMGEEEGAGLFRTEKLYRRTHNDAMQFDYAGLSHFSSSEKKDKIDFMGRLGFRNNGNWSFYGEGNTRFADCFFGIRYILSQHNYAPNRHKMVVDEKKDYVYRNRFALPILFSADPLARTVDSRDFGGNPFAFQQALADSLNGRENHIFIPAETGRPVTENLREEVKKGFIHYEKMDPEKPAFVTWKIRIGNPENLLFYLDAPHTQDAVLHYGGDEYGSYFSTYRWNIINTTRHREGEEFEVRIEAKGEELDLSEAYFCYEDRDRVNALMEEILSMPSHLEKVTSSHLKGTVTGTRERSCALLSIPWDRGWHIQVDGKETEGKKAAGMLLSFDITPGEHSVELKYIPEGTTAGSLISILALILLLTGAKVQRRNRAKPAENPG